MTLDSARPIHASVGPVPARHLHLLSKDDKKSESLLFWQIIENSFDSVWVLSLPSYDLEYANQEVTERMLGYPIESFFRDRNFWLSVVFEDDRPIAVNTTRTCLREGAAQARYRMVRKDGRILWVLARLRLVKDVDGEPIRILGSSIDITPLVTVERRLEYNLERIHAILSSIDDIVFEITGECRFVEVWYKQPEFLYFPREEFIGKRFAEVFPAEFAARLEKEVERALESGEPVSMEYKDLKGADRWFSAQFRPIKQGQHQQIQSRLAVVISDITSRKKAEEALRKSEETLAAITALSPDIISIVSREARFQFVSAGVERVHGYKVEEVLGHDGFDFVHPDDRSALESVLRRIPKEPERTFIFEFRVRNRDGSYRWMEGLASDHNDNPAIRGIIVITRDISQRKGLEQDLRSALAARDEFLSVASHELKNPVSALYLQLQVLGKLVSRNPKLAQETQVRNVANRSLNACRRVNSLLENLLDVTRIRAGKLNLDLRPTDLAATIESVLGVMAEELARSGSTVSVSAPPTLIGKWDGDRIDQVVHNLVSNATKYGEGKPIEIEAWQDVPRGKAWLVVQDHGIGISDEIKEKLFHRFERGGVGHEISGLGLGLYIVRQILEAHGGKIWVESTLGKGSRFVVELPLNA